MADDETMVKLHEHTVNNFPSSEAEHINLDPDGEPKVEGTRTSSWHGSRAFTSDVWTNFDNI